MSERLTTVGNDPDVKPSAHRFPPVFAWLLVAALCGSIILLVLARSGPGPDQLRSEARAASGARHWQQAESLLARIDNPAPEDWLLRAVVAHERKQDDAAAEYLDKLPPQGPLAARAALARGTVERARFRARAMEASLLKALELDANIPEARSLLVYLYGTQDRRSELIEQFAKLLEVGTVSLELVNHSCLSHYETITEPANVETDLKRFLANDPEDRASRIALANCRRGLRAFDEAIEILSPLPDSDADARAVRAETELDRGNLPAAVALLKDTPETHAKLAQLRGRLALNLGDLPAAVRYYRMADTLRPNNQATLYTLGQALRRSGESEAAELAERQAGQLRSVHAQIDRASDTKETKAQVACRLAASCETAQLWVEARAYYRVALAADPLNPEAQRGLFRLSDRATKANSPDPAKPR